jgi:hypothetical protein
MSLRRVFVHSAALSLLPGCATEPTDIFNLRKIAFQPLCAQACRAVITNSPLECTSNTTHLTSAECYASNIPFLNTLALCIKTHCNDLSLSNIGEFWGRNAVGWDNLQPSPQYSYEEALGTGGTPAVTIRRGDPVNAVSLIDEEDYSQVLDLMSQWNDSEKSHAIYA